MFQTQIKRLGKRLVVGAFVNGGCRSCIPHPHFAARWGRR